jgi:hypothetical protein
MAMNVLLITPPLTQLNTPYPATAYLSSFLKQNGYATEQFDLGIELINLLFTKSNIERIFNHAESKLEIKHPKHIFEKYENRDRYIATIESVMNFLRGTDNTLAHRICSREFLAESYRFKNINDLEWAFGTMGQYDMAKYIATLYIEDLTDFITETIDKHFSLNRYAEKLCTYITDFKVVERQIKAKDSIIDELVYQLLEQKITSVNPDLIGFSIPFPGNFLYALKMGNYIKKHFPQCDTVFGGGFVNTELRWLGEPALFKYTDFVILDDGEDALFQLCLVLEKRIEKEDLLRTFFLESNGVQYISQQIKPKKAQGFSNCPDYTGLPLDKYISMVETTNPLSKIWTDGKWNKMMLAHGCYWAKCAFCDTSVPYIRDYQPGKASVLVGQMVKIMGQTGQSGFHFVDEAAPPKLLKDLSIEILKRGLVVSWWGNIRFEKAFDEELCQLMAQAGCIAVSGGLETASDRLLTLMNKGVTIEQAAKASHHFNNAGIMVHAYLMYGFPSETLQETIDSLEIVRQFFEEGLIQSAFWHRYIMTVHSPTGLNPEKFGAKISSNDPLRFAKNDVDFSDNTGVDLDMVGKALNKSMYNYMQGIGYEIPVHEWFSAKVPKTKVRNDLIRNYLGAVV